MGGEGGHGGGGGGPTPARPGFAWRVDDVVTPPHPYDTRIWVRRTVCGERPWVEIPSLAPRTRGDLPEVVLLVLRHGRWADTLVVGDGPGP